MIEKHSYTNPSEEQNLAHVEAGSDDDGFGFAGAETIIDENGWRQRAPIPASETVRLALENSEQLCGLNKLQIQELLKGEFSSYECFESGGGQYRKVVIKYDVKDKT